jgi:hypothetical protein
MPANCGQHADLADPVEGRRRHRCQTHQQVDHEEGKHRHQAQGEEIEAAVAPDAGVDRLQALPEALRDPVAQQEAGCQEGQRGTDAGGEGDQHRAPEQAEDGAAGQGHHRRSGQRQGGHCDVNEEEDAGGEPGMGLAVGLDRSLLRLERVEAEVSAEVEREIEARGDGDQHQQQQFSQ